MPFANTRSAVHAAERARALAPYSTLQARRHLSSRHVRLRLMSSWSPTAASCPYHFTARACVVS